ncbi:patatin-like phospholipase family protein [Lichenifustis flavocetrariae]|uniref:Patatin-like phospholipase family protein n=1 Tax=Lichenifustis flavocetrariae TaxID=2949735 RepID=A0AA41YSD4_9HYPH|nr:patatin-like phospholipase family protein [Lichenifustis flavocetrariae]MCW6507686.1 patatin-like phospholipase family protein [Lichenifustis flavocetrariae]
MTRKVDHNSSRERASVKQALALQRAAGSLSVRTNRQVSLALQGGGSLGAFTWGVLDRLLEADNVSFDAVSGASAGAINAAVMASGFAKSGRTGAREALERFWRRASGAALAPAFSDALAFSARVLSPYEFNPFDLNPLRLLLSHEVDVDCIRRSPFRLLLGATRVGDGSLRLFRESEITIDVLLASACLPLLNQAVAIDGADYWDGGYAANPPLLPLIETSSTDQILVVQIIPQKGAAHPRSKKDIVRRLDHIAFGASLTHDLGTIDMIKALTQRGDATRNKIASCEVARISAEDAWPGLAEADPLNLDWGFLCDLRDAGRGAAETWLTAPAPEKIYARPSPAAQSASRPARYVG